MARASKSGLRMLILFLSSALQLHSNLFIAQNLLWALVSSMLGIRYGSYAVFRFSGPDDQNRPDYVGSQLAAVLALLDDGPLMKTGLALVLMHG
ncbi:hypothetical protein BDW66DRAFT_131852 [Aspergillus desertorum]